MCKMLELLLKLTSKIAKHAEKMQIPCYFPCSREFEAKN
jgi:hypothetical protein